MKCRTAPASRWPVSACNFVPAPRTRIGGFFYFDLFSSRLMFPGTNLYGKLRGGGITASYLQSDVINEDVNNISKQVTCTMVFFQYFGVSMSFLQQNLLQ